MQCTNCGNEVPDTAKVCGHCGHRLKADGSILARPAVVPARLGTPRWVWGVLGMFAALAVILFIGAMGMLRVDRNIPQPNQDQGVVIPTRVEVTSTPTIISTPTPTRTPAKPIADVLTSDQDRCGLFDKLDMSIVYLDWQPGAALTFYAKMPGGVPGLEKTIPDDEDPWNYSAEVGDYESESCIYQGYKERLYCAISLPFDYSNAIQPLSVHVNNCNTPIYNDPTADLPGIVGKSSSGGNNGGPSNGNGNNGGSSCGSAPSAGCTSDYATWCACTGGSYTCGFAGPVCY